MKSDRHRRNLLGWNAAPRRAAAAGSLTARRKPQYIGRNEQRSYSAGPIELTDSTLPSNCFYLHGAAVYRKLPGRRAAENPMGGKRIEKPSRCPAEALNCDLHLYMRPDILRGYPPARSEMLP